MANGNNSLNNNFGMNIRVPQKVIKQSQSTAQNAVSNLWQPLFNFIEKNQAVFTGNIANEIERYNLMTYNIGAALREGKTTGDFNVQG